MDVCTCLEDSDEILLLDDESTEVNCRKCKRNGPTTSINGTLVFQSTKGIEEINTELPEDSPLLINDLYRSRELDDFHCHDHITNNIDESAWKKLLCTSIFCFLFMLTEALGGYLAGSLAVMIDAAHLFSDYIGFGISLFSIWIVKRPPSKRMTFGYHRVEVVGAIISIVTIYLLAMMFLILAINRLWHGEYEIDVNTMLIISSLGVAVNIVMGTILHGTCHNHSHSSSSSNISSNLNVRAVTAHVVGDIIQSVGVLIAAIIIKIWPNAKLADPICTIFFSLIVIFSLYKIGRDSLWYLLEGSPINSMELAVELHNIPSVCHVHNLHVWSLAPGRDVVTVHLAVDRFCDRDLVLKKATSIINNLTNVLSCTVQIENYNSDLINSCKFCQTYTFRC